ncbi:uncharacterized protein, partial [Montipora capricornis]|uniref:uncharacterized protein n=1 Tax=Montipora capricornis TaxID=246305 RepID=UPI0035F1F1EC
NSPHLQYGNFTESFFRVLNISQVLVFSKFEDYFQCAIECVVNKACFSFNFGILADNGSGGHICHLLASDKYNHSNHFVPSEEFHHFSFWSPCESFPCQNGGTCHPEYETNSYQCECGEGGKGTHCETKIWQKINTDPVCFGAADDSFGTSEIHKPGDIYRLKLIHRSGYLNCISKITSATKWGCERHPSKLNTHITDHNNVHLFPVSGTVEFEDHLYYEPPGFHENSVEIEFDSIVTPLFATAGQQFRVWYGEDLTNLTEHDNIGQSCIDVYGVFQVEGD